MSPGQGVQLVKGQAQCVCDEARVLRVQHQPPHHPQQTVSDDVLAVQPGIAQMEASHWSTTTQI